MTMSIILALLVCWLAMYVLTQLIDFVFRRRHSKRHLIKDFFESIWDLSCIPWGQRLENSGDAATEVTSSLVEAIGDLTEVNLLP